LTEDERHRLILLLATSRDALTEITRALTEREWAYKPTPDAWCPQEIVEHLAATERSVLTLVTERLPERAASADGGHGGLDDDEVVARLEDRNRKVKSPERARRAASYPSAGDAMHAFHAARTITLGYAQETTDDLRTRLGPHPAVGVIDGFQWLLFLGAHTNRHVAQIREALDR